MVLTVVALIVVVVYAVVKDDDPVPVPTTAVDGPDRDLEPDKKLKLGAPAREVIRDTEDAEQGPQAGRAHPDVAPDAVRELRGRDPHPEGVLPQGGGSQGFPGCSTRFVGSYSQRGGATIKAVGLHYTAGPNHPGLTDMNGLTAYSNRNQVSWHFLIDREGHCYYSVPLAAKAWTIGNLNPETVNIEVVGRGNEPGYGGTAGAAKLGAVVREVGRRYSIPMSVGAVSNCRVTRRGVVTHWQGGGCSGGHHDIRPYDLARVVAEIRAGGRTSVLVAYERAISRKRCYHRSQHIQGRAVTQNKRWARHYIHKIGVRRAELRKLGLTPRRNRARRHRLLGAYATGKAC